MRLAASTEHRLKVGMGQEGREGWAYGGYNGRVGGSRLRLSQGTGGKGEDWFRQRQEMAQ